MLSSLRRKGPFERRDKSPGVPRHMLPVLENGGVPTLREVLPKLSTELDRARRHSRPLSVAVFGLDPVATDIGQARASSESHGPNQTGLFPLLSALLAPSLREALRQTDIVSYTTREAQSLVVLPETTAEGARRTISRVLQMSSIQVLCPLRVGIASFPDDGWTLEDVIVRAEEEWARSGPMHLDAGRGDE
jgi:hypothetical protein